MERNIRNPIFFNQNPTLVTQTISLWTFWQYISIYLEVILTMAFYNQPMRMLKLAIIIKNSQMFGKKRTKKIKNKKQTKNKPKRKKKEREKSFPPNTSHFSEWFSKSCLAPTIYITEIILFFMCHLLVKVIVLFELFDWSNFFFYACNFSDFSNEIIYIYELLFSGLLNV